MGAKQSAFLKAIAEGNIEAVTRLLLGGGIVINPVKSTEDSLPLYVAALRDHVDIAQLLIENGALVNAHVTAKGAEGTTALMIAALNCNMDMLAVLLEHDAEVDQQDAIGMSALHYAASLTGNTDAVVFLLDASADVNLKNASGSTPLHVAAEKGHSNIARTLIERGANNSIKDDDGLTAGALAFMKGNTTTAEYIQSHVFAYAREATRPSRSTAISRPRGRSPSPPGARAASPTGRATSPVGRATSPVGRATSPPTGRPASHTTVYRPLSPTASRPLSPGATRPLSPTTGRALSPQRNLSPQRGLSPTRAPRALSPQRPPRALSPIRHRSPPPMSPRPNRTVTNVMSAYSPAPTQAPPQLPPRRATSAAPGMLQHALNKNATAAAAANGGAAPPVPARRGRSPDRRRSRAMSTQDLTPELWDAATFGRVARLRVLITKGADVNVITAAGVTPLEAGVLNGKLDVVKLLIDSGADVNKSAATSPLLSASTKGFLEAVRLLIEAKADVNKASADGMTPLMAAARWGHKNVVHVLLANGANKYFLNKYGRTAADCAEDPELRRILAISNYPLTRAGTGTATTPRTPGSPAATASPVGSSPIATATATTDSGATTEGVLQMPGGRVASAGSGGISPRGGAATSEPRGDIEASNLILRVQALSAKVPRGRSAARASINAWENDLSQVASTGKVINRVAGYFSSLSAVCGLLSDIYEAYDGVRVATETCALLVDRCSRLSMTMSQYAVHLISHPPASESSITALFGILEVALRQALTLIDRWSTKGKQAGWFKKLVGSISDIASNGLYQRDFENVNALLTQCFQSLAADEAFQGVGIADAETEKQNMSTALTTDVGNVEMSILQLADENLEFSNEMRAQWISVSESLTSIGVNVSTLALRFSSGPGPMPVS